MLALLRLQALLLMALFAVICFNAIATYGLVGGLMIILSGLTLGILIIKMIK